MNFEKKPDGRKKTASKAEIARRRAYFEEQRRRERLKKRNVSVCAVATLLLASLLLFSVAIYELVSGNEKYIYTFNGTEKKFDKSDIFADDIQYIDMNSLAELCSFEKTKFFSSMIYRANGTEIAFENGSDTASVNSLSVKMTANAKIDDEYCFVPLQSILQFIPSLSAKAADGKTEITLNIQKESVYIMASSGLDIDYATDISAYLEYINTNDKSVLILANKTVILGEDYEPTDLVEIPSEYRKDSKIYLSLPAEKALEAMMQDMRALGFSDVYVTSAYRSYEYQEMLFEGYIKDEMQRGLSYDEAVAEALKYSAAPGTSEHQTGLCIDFTTASIGGVVDDIFEGTSVFPWLLENAWKYGFILRYPEDKVEITQYNYESWHYRFVGLETAAKIYQSGLCYEEYLEIFEN